MTRLHIALGLPAPDERAEPAPALIDGARAFLLGGGSLSLQEWSEQSAAERRALALAGRGLRGEAADDELVRRVPSGGQASAPPAGWTTRDATEASGRARLAAKRSLLEALQARGFDLPRGLESLEEQLVRLSMASLIHAMATGFPLETAVERFERAHQVKQAAAPPPSSIRPRARRRRARTASPPEAPSAAKAPSAAASEVAPRGSAQPRRAAKDPAAPNPDQTALF